MFGTFPFLAMFALWDVVVRGGDLGPTGWVSPFHPELGLDY